jgi:hypothetical protein
MFTGSPHTVLFCTVTRSYERQLRTVVLQVDPSAFIVIGHGHPASGGMFGPSLRSVSAPSEGRRGGGSLAALRRRRINTGDKEGNN